MRANLRREWSRISRQIAGVPWFVLGPLRRRHYDWHRAQRVRCTEGALLAGDEMAVQLIYQPDGLADSLRFRLSWLISQDVVPVVVSNLPLSDADRAALCAQSHLVIERPNIGYDFGGYREGIIAILDRGLRPRALYVMNDSMWFPLSEDADAIRHAKASDSDLYGLLCNRVTRGPSRFYLQSYFFRFGKRMIESPAFRNYWRRMPLIDNKHKVVHRLERQLTSYFASRGFSIGWRHHADDLVEALLALDDDALAEAVRFMIDAERKDKARLAPLVESGRAFAEIRTQIEDMIRKRLVQSTFFAHPAVLRRMGVSFLKRADVAPLRVQRRWLVELGLTRDLAEPIRREIVARVTTDAAGG